MSLAAKQTPHIIRVRHALMALVAALPCVAGCPTVFDGVGAAVTDGNRDASVTSPLGKTRGEPNDSFNEPIVAVFDAAGTARLQGAIARIDDFDVYLLPGLAAGDRVLVDVGTSGSALDSAIGIFDEEGRLVFENDDRDSTSLDSAGDWILRRQSNAYYLLVAATQDSSVPRRYRSGSYTVDITRLPGQAIPPPAQQILFLNFDGGELNSPLGGRLTLDRFDAGDISSVYRGQTAVVKDALVATMIQNFERFNVLVVSSDDGPLADGVKFSTLHFGGFNASAYGIADAVDLNNIDRCDDAIIFVESFGPFGFSVTPTSAEIGVAIGNIGAHEAGHLLGLNHVADDLDLMDDQSAADAFLLDQEFLESPLSPAILPLGTQDAVLLLTESVGLAE